MGFMIKSKIEMYESLADFLKEKTPGKTDLIVSNEYVLLPALKGEELPCDVIYIEKYGQGEPYDEMIEAMLQDIDGKGYKRIIAIGGGSVIDTSKFFVFGDGYTLDDLYKKGASLSKERELIAVPTTCGTGSEVTNIAVVSFKKLNSKLGLQIPQLFADEAALIPGLLKSLPFDVFANSSIDAFVHAMEPYVSPRANEYTKMFGKTAMEKIVKGYKEIRATGERKLPQDMEDFMIASNMAGISFLNAGCAAVHAMAFPIGANYHLPHGSAVYTMFEETFKMYKELGADIAPAEKVLSEVLECDKDKVWEELFDLFEYILPRTRLREFGVDESKCEEMAASVIENQQRLMVNTPVKLSLENVKTIFQRTI